jgi:alpha-maltose-1-phosphate synthase
MTVQVTVVSAYRFHMFELARQMQRRGALRRLVTAMPRHLVHEVPDWAMRSRPWSALARAAWRKAHGPDFGIANRTVITDFDRWASKNIDGSDVVSGLSSFATHTLRLARRRGMLTVCDRGSWHILEQKRVLDEQAEKLSWPPVRFSTWIIDRELEEYEQSDAIFVPSERARLSFIHRSVAPERLHVVPYGCDLEAFYPDHTSRQPGRILSVGPVGLQKGHPYLVGAFRRLSHGTATLALVGPAEPFAVSRLDLRRTGAGTNSAISVLGSIPRDGVAEEMRRSSVFVLASLQEGLALVIAQAMSSGLPVIATEATGAAELMTHGVEGLIIPSADQGALAEAMAFMLDNPDVASVMGMAGRARIASLGGWDTYGASAFSSFDSLRHEQN